MSNIRKEADRVLESFTVDTEAYQIGEDSIAQYNFNFGYACGQISGLTSVCEWSDFDYVSSIRSKIEHMFLNVERKKDK